MPSPCALISPGVIALQRYDQVVAAGQDPKGRRNTAASSTDALLRQRVASSRARDGSQILLGCNTGPAAEQAVEVELRQAGVRRHVFEPGLFAIVLVEVTDGPRDPREVPAVHEVVRERGIHGAQGSAAFLGATRFLLLRMTWHYHREEILSLR